MDPARRFGRGCDVCQTGAMPAQNSWICTIATLPELGLRAGLMAVVRGRFRHSPSMIGAERGLSRRGPAWVQFLMRGGARSVRLDVPVQGSQWRSRHGHSLSGYRLEVATSSRESPRSRPEEKRMASKTHSRSGELFRMGVAAAVGAAAAYGGRALWKQLPAIMASTAVGRVEKVADKVKGGAVEGASRVVGGARENASRTASSSSGTAKKPASAGASAADRTTTAARRSSSAAGRTSSAARRTSSGGSSAKSRARKPA